MPTGVLPTGLAWLAQQIAGQAFIISAHTGDPGDTLADNEHAGGNYARIEVDAADISQTNENANNPDVITGWTPAAAEAGTVINHLGIRIDLASDVVYARAELVAPVTLVEGVAFEIAAETLSFMFATA